jgi:hypothetical protein
LNVLIIKNIIISALQIYETKIIKKNQSIQKYYDQNIVYINLVNLLAYNAGSSTVTTDS